MSFKIPNYKVLVIDDFAQMRNTCRRMLMDFRAKEIDDCGNGEDAIQMMRQTKYDIVLCDYNLGDGKDGQQILEEARHEGILDYASIFMMITGENARGMVLSAVEYEPDEYLTKPFTKEVLARRLAKLVERKRGLNIVGKALEAKDYATASQICDRLIEKLPKNVINLLKIKAVIHLQAEEYELAKNVYESVLSQYNIAWARLGLGKIHFFDQQYLDAKQTFSALIREFPNQMEAYDWLAKTLAALDEKIEAQSILQQASEKSPKVLIRRQRLADMALENEDFAAAELSCKAAVKLSKGSSYKRPDDFTNLANLLIEKKKDQKALTYLRQGKDEFRNDPSALLKLNINESKIHHQVNRESQAKDALSRAMTIYNKHDAEVNFDPGGVLDLAEASLIYGNKDKGLDIMRQVIENNHDNQGYIDKARQAFNNADMVEEGEALLKESIGNVVDINNEGARLANEGKLDEAIELFSNAAQRMPLNRVISLNAAQALILNMRKNGVDRSQLIRCDRYLENVKQLDPADTKYRKLLKTYQDLTAL